MDEDLREALHVYVNAVPPAVTLTAAHVIRRGRRDRRIRLGVRLTGSVVVAAASLLLVLRPSGQPIPDPGFTPSATMSIRGQEAVRLTRVLNQFMAELQPHATFLPNGEIPAFGGAGRPATTALTFVDEDSYFFASADIEDSAGVGSIRVWSGMVDTPFRTDRVCPQDPPPRDVELSCEAWVLPNGDMSMQMTTTIGGKGKNMVVEIIKVNGTSVIVQVANFPAAPLSKGQEQRYRPTPPLAGQIFVLAQQAALATTLH